MNPVLIGRAGLLGLASGLVLAAQPANAQSPVPANPAPAVARPMVTAPTPIATVVTPGPTVARRIFPVPNRTIVNPRTRVYSVPSQGTTSTPTRLHYGYWPARREVTLLKPWLKPD